MNDASLPTGTPAKSAPPRLRSTQLVLALSVALAVAWFLIARGYWEDDAFIHLEFARSLAAGHGFQFNGHLVYGDTSPLWVVLLIAAHAVLPDWLAAGKLLTAVSAVFTLSGVFFFARSLVFRSLHAAEASHFAALMLLAFVLQPYFGYWAFSGMEALAATGLVCWTCVLLTRHRHSWRRLLLASLLAGVGPLLRPEMAFFAGLVALLLFHRIRQLHVVTTPRRLLTLKVDLLLGSLALLIAPGAAWAWYALRTFGRVLPNTNAAKRAAPTDSVLSRLLHIYAFGYPVTVLACLLLAGFVAWYLTRGRRGKRLHLRFALPEAGWLIFVWTAILCVFYVGNHTFVQTRYIFVTAPVLTVAVLALAAVRFSNIYRNLLIVTLLFGAAVSLLSTLPLVRNKVAIDAIFADLSATMRTLPADVPVALYAIGETSFLSQHPVIDTGGITRPSVIPYIYDADDRRITAWAIAQGARYDVVDHRPVPDAQLLWSRDIPVTGWYFDPRRYRLTERLQLWTLPRDLTQDSQASNRPHADF